jgi:hypothetical protein
MGGTGHADGLVMLHVSGNQADAVPCEGLPFLMCEDGSVQAFLNFLSAFSNHSNVEPDFLATSDAMRSNFPAGSISFSS